MVSHGKVEGRMGHPLLWLLGIVVCAEGGTNEPPQDAFTSSVGRMGRLDRLTARLRSCWG